MRHTRWQIPGLAAAAVLVVVLGSLLLLRSPQPSLPEDARTTVVEPSPAPRAVAAPTPPAAAASAPSVPPPTRTPTSVQVAVPVATPPGPRAEQIFGVRRGVVRAADAEDSSGGGSLAVPEAVGFPDPSFALRSPIEPLAPITITPIQVTPIVVSPVTVNALPGGK